MFICSNSFFTLSYRQLTGLLCLTQALEDWRRMLFNVITTLLAQCNVAVALEMLGAVTQRSQARAS